VWAGDELVSLPDRRVVMFRWWKPCRNGLGDASKGRRRVVGGNELCLWFAERTWKGDAVMSESEDGGQVQYVVVGDVLQ
jgi:hypothetical protein